MLSRRVLSSGPLLSVAEFRCTAGPADPTYVEQHEAWSVAYVRYGSFGCRCGGASHELVPGSLLIGRPGEQYRCSHEHHAGGDACLAVFVSPDVVDELTDGRAWSSTAVPPLPELIVRGALMQSAAAGDTDVGLDEAALGLVSRYAERCGRLDADKRAPVRMTAASRRRAVQSALWIEAYLAQPLDLQRMAAEAAMSPYHYLRVFSAALGVTPHQYLLRCRLRLAARLLAEEAERPITEVALDAGFADLSNFVRTFHRAAGVSPGWFRSEARKRGSVARVHRLDQIRRA